MSDLPVVDAGADPEAIAAEVRARLADALAAAGLDGHDPQVRTAVLEALNDKPVDRRYTVAEKRKYCLELRLAGGSYREIGRIVGISHAQAHRHVLTALKELPREPAEQVRQMAIERLEAILSGSLYRKALGKRVNGKDTPHAEQMAAIDRVVMVMREERRYIPGVEVPVNAELTGAGGGAIIVELSIPAPVPTVPVPQHELAGLVDLPPGAMRVLPKPSVVDEP